MSYNTRYKSKQIAEKLAALRNIDPELSGESGDESDTNEITTEENENSGATCCLHCVYVYGYFELS